MKSSPLLLCCLVFLASPFATPATLPPIESPPSKNMKRIEVLHWWTSGSEIQALHSLKQKMETTGHHWQDFAVGGLAGESAKNTLRIRALSGNPPNAAQIKGPEIHLWGNSGFLTPLNDLVQTEDWDTQIPAKIADYLKVKEEYIAVPLNVHRVNLLWANPMLFTLSGAQLPHSLDEFFIAAEKIKKAGFTALALGNEPWQEATLFESIALAVLGTDDFKKAFLLGDETVLTGEKMHLSLTTFRRMKQYTDSKSPGRNWSATTALLIQQKAAMQFMGDWAKGEFIAAQKKENIDFVCLPAPGTQHQFSFNTDSFVFFKTKDKQIRAAQKAMANLILEPEFQKEFNLRKGSIPVRMDLDIHAFDACAKASKQAFLHAAKTDNLLASVSHSMGLGQAGQSALFDVLSRFFNNDEITPEESIRHLRAAVLADKL